MDLVALLAASFFASMLTFFSGFGLGTILLPVFSIWFPVPTAVAITALVHFANNLFKLSLTQKHIDRKVFFNFGFPALLAAPLGAALLTRMNSFDALMSYNLYSHTYSITPIKLAMSLIMILFIAIEFAPPLKLIPPHKLRLFWGGVLSGFFGGLSGHQGALRSLFLANVNLKKETFIATGIAIACVVDVIRLVIYSGTFFTVDILNHSKMIFLSVLSAFAGALLGHRLLKKITFDLIQKIVSIFLLILAVGIGTGLI